jgi:hypothetical protein
MNRANLIKKGIYYTLGQHEKDQFDYCKPLTSYKHTNQGGLIWHQMLSKKSLKHFQSW